MACAMIHDNAFRGIKLLNDLKNKDHVYVIMVVEQNVSFHKRISKKCRIHTYVFHELTNSRYFIVLVRKNGIWHLTLVQSAVGTGSEL